MRPSASPVMVAAPHVKDTYPSGHGTVVGRCGLQGGARQAGH